MNEKIGIGRTAEIYDYGNGKVLKLFFDTISEDEISNEYNNNLIIESLNIPSVKCYELITYKNRRGLVIEKINGLSMMKKMEMKPMQSMTYAFQLARVHFEIHKSITANLPDNKEQLISRIQSIESLSNHTKNDLIKYIGALENDTTVCHNDFHPENIFTANNGFIVFDWASAAKGSRYSDVAHTNLLLRYGVSPDTKNPIELFIMNKTRNKFADLYLKEYMKLSNCSREDINKWEIPHMASMLNDVMSEKTKLYFITQIEKFTGKGI